MRDEEERDKADHRKRVEKMCDGSKNAKHKEEAYCVECREGNIQEFLVVTCIQRWIPAVAGNGAS